MSLKSDFANSLNQINSNLPSETIKFVSVSNIHLTSKGITKITVNHNLALSNWYRVLINTQFGDDFSAVAWAERFASTVTNMSVYNVQSNSLDIVFNLTEATDIYTNLNILILI